MVACCVLSGRWQLLGAFLAPLIALSIFIGDFAYKTGCQYLVDRRCSSDTTLHLLVTQ